MRREHNYTQELVRRWWLIVLRGVLGVGVGLLLVAIPVKSLVVVTWLIGWYALLEGTIQVGYAIIKHRELERALMTVLQGFLGMLMGLLLLNWPGISLAIGVFLVGVWLLCLGILMIAQAIRVRDEIEGGEGYLLAGAVVFLAVGVLMISNLVTTVRLAGLLVGVGLLLWGLFTLAFGYQLKRDLKT